MSMNTSTCALLVISCCALFSSHHERLSCFRHARVPYPFLFSNVFLTQGARAHIGLTFTPSRTAGCSLLENCAQTNSLLVFGALYRHSRLCAIRWYFFELVTVLPIKELSSSAQFIRPPRRWLGVACTIPVDNEHAYFTY